MLCDVGQHWAMLDKVAQSSAMLDEVVRRHDKEIKVRQSIKTIYEVWGDSPLVVYVHGIL
jgi:hypothetical protein